MVPKYPSGTDIKRNRAVEKGRHITPPSYLTAKMKPFNFAVHHGIKHDHMWAFSHICFVEDIIILVRATNEASIAWIGQPGYQAKPIDCKPKTADINIFINDQYVECAGLVGCPELLPPQAYKKKFSDVMDTWKSFKSKMVSKQLNSGVKIFLRQDSHGFYAVDNDSGSRHYGCLLISKQQPPDDFDLTKEHSRRWKANNMAYIHGDYDLYGIIDISKIGQLQPGEVQKIAVSNQKLLGQNNFVTEHSEKVANKINALLDVDMIKHGEQSAWQHQSDKEGIYIFYPDNIVYVVEESQFGHPSEMETYLEELYRYIFKAAYEG